MKVKVEHIITEHVPYPDIGFYIYLDMEFSRDGTDWRTIGTRRKFVETEDKPNGAQMASEFQAELQTRVDNADDKIAELRAIRQEYAG